MNQQKIGCFLKKLRKENNITQEQFAEILGVQTEVFLVGRREQICLT